MTAKKNAQSAAKIPAPSKKGVKKTASSSVKKAAKKAPAQPAAKKAPRKRTAALKEPKEPNEPKGRKTPSKPKASRIPPLSDAEKARRLRHEARKKRHEPSEAERIYGVGRLPIWEPGWLLVTGARQNNLRSIDVPFPLSALTAVTGVSGSGKSSLVEDVLYAALARTLHRAQIRPGAHDRIYGVEALNKVIAVDQQPLGQTPTSNPATYTGVFDLIRELYARLPESKMRGYTPRRFSFNVPGGRCEKCEGAGQLKIEMHFLADVWVTCDACGGRRYEPQTLSVRYRGQSIADVLEMSIAKALSLFSNIPGIARILRTLCDVGLDYLSLGQPAPTLSGGEAQRVKLAAELARPDTGKTLYILDEPTTGLHFDDLAKLLEVLHRLVDLGNTAVVIEHNLDIIKSADWVVDLGPEAGTAGGNLVFAGLPEELVAYERSRLALPPKKRDALPKSWTAESLAPVLDAGPYLERKLFDAAAYQAELEKLRAFNWEEEIDSETPMPWESDGRRWHTVERRGRNGSPCRWDGEILAETVEKIEESDVFADTDWKNRSIVEIRARKKSTGWFFHAITGEEWLLKMKFRVPKNSFKKEELIAALDLRPLNEIDEIPLYGTQTRTRVETTGPWQEIELKVFNREEIDKPEYWSFLDRAIERFSAFAEDADGGVDLTPWKTLGEKWHKAPAHCYGGSAKPKWEISLLDRAVRLIENIEPNVRIVWTNKILVPFYRPDAGAGFWIQMNTKNCEYLAVTIIFPKGNVAFGEIANFGFEPELDTSGADGDALLLRFRSAKEFDAARFADLLKKSVETE